MTNRIRETFKYFIFSLFVSTSCQSIDQDKNINDAVIEVTFEMNPTKLYLSNFADSIQYIPLKTNQEVLLSNRLEFKFTNNYILVNDIGTKKLNLFSKDGSYLNSIGTLGRGIGEYNLVAGYTIDEDSELIFVSDRNKKSILLYDLLGNFKKELSLGFFAGGIEVWKKNQLLIMTAPSIYNKDEVPHILLMDYNGKRLVEKTLPLPRKNSKRDQVFFSPYFNKLRVIPMSSIQDTVFYLTNDLEMLPHLVFRYEGMFDKEHPDYDEYNSIATKGFSFDGMPLETPNYVFWGGSFDNKPANMLYDKTTKKSYHLKPHETNFPGAGLLNDLDNGPEFYPLYQKDGDWLFTVIYTYNFTANKNNYSKTNAELPKSAEKSLEVLKNQDSEDPILMLVRFKK